MAELLRCTRANTLEEIEHARKQLDRMEREWYKDHRVIVSPGNTINKSDNEEIC